MKKSHYYFLSVLAIFLLIIPACAQKKLATVQKKPTKAQQKPPANTPQKSTDFKEADFTKAELDLSSLNNEQKVLVLKLLNNNNCTCGCTKGTWANCIKNDTHCPYSRPMGAQVREMVKQGKPESFVIGYFEGWKEGTKRKKRKRKKDDPNKIYPVTTMNAPVIGPKDAPVIFIEYTDYQCPFCKRVQTTINTLLTEYEGKIRFATMNNPLAFHKRALPAAMAARAAGKQGKFWEMHRLIFDNPRALEDSDLVKLAQKLGLDIEKFNADRKDKELEAELLKEQQQAIKNNATGTPAFFVNGKKISGAQPIDTFRQAIEDALKRTKK